MKTRSIALAAGLSLVSLSASAYEDTYTGTYRWLSFFHATNIIKTATYWNGPTESMGWLASRGADNSDARWWGKVWDQPIVFEGVYVSTFSQFSGGSIGNYEIQYSVDGVAGWTTITTLSSTATYDVNFYSPATGRAMRIHFPGGSYTQGTSGNGPGFYQLLVRGRLDSGPIDPSDPQFNLLAAPGFQGANPAFSFPGRALNTGSGPSLKDQIVTADAFRVGWLPPSQTNEHIQLDLGPSPGAGGMWKIGSVQLYAGVYYYYIPSTLNLMVSSNGAAWSSPMPMSMVNGVLTKSGINQYGRYVRLAMPDPPSSWINGYYLVHEVAVAAYVPPLPKGLLMSTR